MTQSKITAIAFKIFAHLHPVEAYDTWPKRFCKLMKKENGTLTDEQIKELIDSVREEG